MSDGHFGRSLGQSKRGFKGLGFKDSRRLETRPKSNLGIKRSLIDPFKGALTLGIPYYSGS